MNTVWKCHAICIKRKLRHALKCYVLTSSLFLTELCISLQQTMVCVISVWLMKLIRASTESNTQIIKWLSAGWWKWKILCLERESNPHHWHSRLVCLPTYCRLPDITILPTPTCLYTSLPFEVSADHYTRPPGIVSILILTIMYIQVMALHIDRYTGQVQQPYSM